MSGITYTLELLFFVVLLYYLVANLSYMAIMFLGFRNALARYAEKHLNLIERLTPLRVLTPVSILVPCYNEELSIEQSIHSMLQLNYPEFEVVVCNDGSKDRSMEILKRAFHLIRVDTILPQALPSATIKAVYVSSKYPHLTVLDKENGGKSDALNAAINHSRYPLICCVDSDSVLEEKGLSRVVLPFFEDPERTIASGGTILVVNTERSDSSNELINTRVPDSWLGSIQSIEYLRSFLIGRLAWDLLQCNTIISGAFGVFKKELVIRVGGYAHHTIGEDMELALRMQAYCLEHRQPYRVQLLPDPVCWTQPPEDLRTLGNQRSRWQQGLCESLWRNRRVFFRRWGGKMGWLALPYVLVFELLAAPIELAASALVLLASVLGVMEFRIAVLLLLVNILYGGILNLSAIIIDQATFSKFPRLSDTLKLIAASLLEHIGFRQLHLYWRVRGIWRWLRGNRSWGSMVRQGFAK